ncbi:uncharacterized protein LOC133179738 [Saccostrea echinata]|uniref:uncharacterized protein LOC133179738 n=1 Tax=Saccostrea echinata TaxID=191078 RepID=UPI002A8192FB|nr:uncharacterized protein LOC133179738 [Saccostrea echinata]
MSGRDCIIESETTEIFYFHPVNKDWQSRISSLLSMGHFVGSLPTTTNMHVRLGIPSTIQKVVGDGNCFFRCISYTVSGSQQFHSVVRERVINHMREMDDKLTSVLPMIESVANYIRRTRINECTFWATEVEIITAAHLLKTDIFIYSSDHGWQKYSGKLVDPLLQTEEFAIYLKHTNGNHYDVVTNTVQVTENTVVEQKGKLLSVNDLVQQYYAETKRRQQNRTAQEIKKLKVKQRQQKYRERLSAEKKEALRMIDRDRKRKLHENETIVCKEANKIKKKQQRLSIDDEQKRKINEKDRLRKREKRSKLSEEQKSKICASERKRKNEMLKSVTEEQKKEFNKRDRQKKKDKRSNLSEEQKSKICASERKHKKEKLRSLTEEQKTVFNERDRQKKEDKRSNLSEEQKSKICASERKRKKEKLQSLTEEQKTGFNERDRKKKEDKRSNLSEEQKSKICASERKRKKEKLQSLTEEQKTGFNERDRQKKEDKRSNLSEEQKTKICASERKQSRRKQDFRTLQNEDQVIQRFSKDIHQYPEYVCTCCRRLLYRRSVTHVGTESFKNSSEEVVNSCITGRISALGFQWICQTCARYVKKNQIPPQALYNDMEVSDIPEELAKLTSLERRLISRRYPFMKMLALPKGKQSGIKGAVVNVPVNEENVVNKLPRLPNEAGVIPLRLKRKIVYKTHEKFEYIRPNYIKDALNWLRENNELYKDITIYENWETKCSENDKELWTELTTNDQDNNILNRSECLPEESAVKENSEEAHEDIYDDDPVSQLRGVKFESCIQPSDASIDVDKILNIAPGEGKMPLSILMDDLFEELAFPNLLPTGKFGWKHNRKIKLTPKKYFQARLLNEKQTFAADIEYIFVAQTIVETKQITDSMSIALRKSFSATSTGDNITAEMVKNPTILHRHLLKDHGYRFLQPVRGSPPYWQKVQYKLLAAVKQFGIFTWFFTLSAADLRWHDTIQAIASQRGLNLSGIDIDSMSWDQKCSWLRSNPLTAARHFQYRLDCLLKDAILADCQPLGDVLHFFYRIEFQQRGSPHAHGVLWIKDAPHPEKSKEEDVNAFVEKYIKSTIPPEYEDPQLYRLVTQLQKHTHSAACKKTGRQCRFNFPKPVCETTMICKPTPQEENSQDQANILKNSKEILANVKNFVIQTDDLHCVSLEDIFFMCGTNSRQYHIALKESVTDTTIYTLRNPSDVYINNYNPTLLKTWQANMDIQFVSNPYACIQYIVAYITKDEREMGTLLEAASKEASQLGLKQQMKACAKTFTNARSVSAQESVYRILGLPLYKSDFTAVWIPTGLPHQRVHLLKPISVLQGLDDDSENIFTASIEEKYSARPVQLTSWCLANFQAWYDLSTFKDSKDDMQPDLLQEEQLLLEDRCPENFVLEAPNEFIIRLANGSFKVKKRKNKPF